MVKTNDVVYKCNYCWIFSCGHLLKHSPAFKIYPGSHAVHKVLSAEQVRQLDGTHAKADGEIQEMRLLMKYCLLCKAESIMLLITGLNIDYTYHCIHQLRLIQVQNQVRMTHKPHQYTRNTWGWHKLEKHQ